MHSSSLMSLSSETSLSSTTFSRIVRDGRLLSMNSVDPVKGIAGGSLGCLYTVCIQPRLAELWMFILVLLAQEKPAKSHFAYGMNSILFVTRLFPLGLERSMSFSKK